MALIRRRFVKCADDMSDRFQAYTSIWNGIVDLHRAGNPIQDMPTMDILKLLGVKKADRTLAESTVADYMDRLGKQISYKGRQGMDSRANPLRKKTVKRMSTIFATKADLDRLLSQQRSRLKAYLRKSQRQQVVINKECRELEAKITRIHGLIQLKMNEIQELDSLFAETTKDVREIEQLKKAISETIYKLKIQDQYRPSSNLKSEISEAEDDREDQQRRLDKINDFREVLKNKRKVLEQEIVKFKNLIAQTKNEITCKRQPNSTTNVNDNSNQLNSTSKIKESNKLSKHDVTSIKIHRKGKHYFYQLLKLEEALMTKPHDRKYDIGMALDEEYFSYNILDLTTGHSQSCRIKARNAVKNDNEYLKKIFKLIQENCRYVFLSELKKDINGPSREAYNVAKRIGRARKAEGAIEFLIIHDNGILPKMSSMNGTKSDVLASSCMEMGYAELEAPKVLHSVIS